MARSSRVLALTPTFLAVAIAAMAGCSLLVDTDATQCAVDEDCAKLGLPTCQAGVCVAPIDGGSIGDATSSESGEPCSSTQDCLALNVAYSVCTSAGTCAPVTSQDCGLVVGEYTRDDALIVGAILPLLGANESAGLAMRDALRVALDAIPNGVPAGKSGANRPVAIVFCNDADDPARAAKHLVEDLAVPLIVGGVTPEIATAIVGAFDPAQPAMLISPTLGTLSPALTSAATVARDLPDDAALAGAIAAEIEVDLEPDLRATNGDQPIRVVVVHPTDVSGAALATAIGATLTVDGMSTAAAAKAGLYVDVDDGDPTTPNAPSTIERVNEAIASASSAAAPPDLIVIVGRTEGVTSILAGVEAAWPPSASARPRYLLGDGLMVQELLTESAMSDPLRQRIRVAERGADPIVDTTAQAFFMAYQSTIAGNSLATAFGAEQAYDALLVSMLGLAAGTTPAMGATDDLVRGGQIASGLAAILEAPASGAPPAIAIDLEAPGVAIGLGDARNSSPLDVHGASGYLDVAVRGTGGLVQIVCIVRSTSDATTSFEASGRVFDVATRALAGTMRSDCANGSSSRSTSDSMTTLTRTRRAGTRAESFRRSQP